MIALAMAATETVAASPALTEKQFFLLLAFALMVVQFVYRVWEKKDNKAVLAELQAGNQSVINTVGAGNKVTLEAINKSLKTMAPHMERSRQTLGLLKDLHHMHNVRDDDGRLLWYMPKEIISAQREIVQLMHHVTTTQDHIGEIAAKQNQDLGKTIELLREFMLDHRDRCSSQMDSIKDEIRKTK